ncbi:hypothetical protein, variant [Aphanomyces invadans]|uniref:F-box domain-containing protein n=1 Tax=Aphanomyces invadans TaxID=157072 RepID=A0A024UF21_9STRA|nr:hypothetical protein, variant [Aphanomyces invadans]ETW04991.1 hypothetical protein, variant [Aphanomyces invadans]|eukprot:XP_008866428.1 hypothetical protein, variant [Aphanomyces invadans]
MRQQRRTHSQDSIDELPREWIVLNPVAAARHTLANWRLFGSINDESVQRVLNYLDGRSLAAASQVCKHLRWMASDDAMWLQACRAEWGVCPHHLSKTQDPLGGKELYFFATQSMRASNACFPFKPHFNVPSPTQEWPQCRTMPNSLS